MKKTSENGRGIFLSCLYAQIVWALSTVILMLIFCIVAYSTADPDSITTPLSLCALYLSALIGGIAAVRISGDGIVSGAVSGVITAILVFAISVLPLPESGFDLPSSLLFTALVIPASVIGSIVGHKRKKSPLKHSKIKKIQR